MKITSEIIITLKREGFHCWPDAPYQVYFLSETHRHMFTFKVCIPVSHGNRQHEFFMESDILDTILKTYEFFDDGSTMSCEQVAKEILENMSHAKWVEVWEDDENGARVTNDDLHNRPSKS